jgi:hypothetical protein
VFEDVVETDQLEPFVTSLEGVGKVPVDDLVEAVSFARPSGLGRDGFHTDDARLVSEDRSQGRTESAPAAAHVQHRPGGRGDGGADVLSADVGIQILLRGVAHVESPAVRIASP